ncbi:MAG: pitrilysin family protein [Bacteroidota bacterium]
MIAFKSFTLDNGLRVIVHEDPSSAIAVVDIMYDVGSRDEAPNKTGFAHLFEHLMFGGSKHIPAYDQALQQVGGDNNAYTTPDVTNYYCTLPASNLETAFWLESDRMLGLSFDPQVLAVQQKVVIEEFKESYLNQPYGDVWLKLCDLAYTQHPYRWPTIGQEIGHIECATMDMVKAFFHQFYVPNNAVLVVAGGVKLEEVKQLSKKWFEPIPPGEVPPRNLPQEPPQNAPRSLTITADVPLNALYKAYHIPGRLAPDYHTVELMTDILGGSKSSRLYEKLVDTQQYFDTISAYTTETIDPGLCIISGSLNNDVSFEAAEAALQTIMEPLQHQPVAAQEVEKAKNQREAYQVFEAVDLLHRAQELAMATVLGDTDLVNQELASLHRVTPEGIQQVAQRIFKADNCSTIYYQRQAATKGS